MTGSVAGRLIVPAGTEDTAEEEAIRRVCLSYVESWYVGDAARMENAVHPELAARFIRIFPSGVDFLEEMGASKLVRWTASGAGRGVPAERQYKDVGVLDIFYRVAMAKVVGAFGVEYLQLGEVGGDWKIVNILGEARTGGPFMPPPLPSTEPTSVDREDPGNDEVVAAARDYAEGWNTGDSSRVARMSHPQWSKKHVRLTESGDFFLESWGAEKMIRWNVSEEHQAELTQDRVDAAVLDRHRGIAAAKVEWSGDVEYFAFVRRQQRWLAVNIMWESDRSKGGPVIADRDRNIWQL